MEEFLPLARVWTFATDHIPLANVVINAGHGVYDKSLEILPGAVSAYVKDVEEKVVETIKSLDTTAGQKITALEETTMVIQAKKIVELVRTDEGTFTLVPLQDMAKEKKEALDLWVKEEWEKVPVEEGTCAHWQHMAGAVLDVTEEKVVVPFKTFCVDKTNEVPGYVMESVFHTNKMVPEGGFGWRDVGQESIAKTGPFVGRVVAWGRPVCVHASGYIKPLVVWAVDKTGVSQEFLVGWIVKMSFKKFKEEDVNERIDWLFSTVTEFVDHPEEQIVAWSKVVGGRESASGGGSAVKKEL